MARQTWVDDFLNLRMGFKSRSDNHCVAHCSFDPDLQCLARAHSEPRVEGIKASAHRLQDEVKLIVQVLVVHTNAACYQVRMTPDVLRQRVRHDVSTQE